MADVKEVLDTTIENTEEVTEKENANSETNTESTVEAQKDDKATETKEEVNIDEIIEKALEKKERAMLKSIFKQQGVKDDDIESKIAEYKEKTAEKKEDVIAVKDAEIEALKKSIETSKAIILKKAVAGRISAAGIDAEKAELFSKLVDTSKFKVSDDFDVDTKKIDEAIQEVLNKVPEFSKKTEAGIKYGVQKKAESVSNKKTYSIADALRASL